MYVSIMAVMKPFIRWAAVDQERTPVEHQHVFQKAKLLTLSTSNLGKKMLFNLVRKHIGFWVITMNVDSPPLLTGLLPKIPKVRPIQEHAGQSNRPSGDKEKVKFKSSVFFFVFFMASVIPSLLFFFSRSVFPFMRRQRHASPSPAQAAAHPAEEDGQAKGAKKAGTNSSVHSNAWCPDGSSHPLSKSFHN